MNFSLPPFVLWVFTLQFLFDLWISLLPEGSQILGGLDRAMVGGEDLKKHLYAAVADGQRAVHSIQILDSGGQERRLVLSILALGMTAGRPVVASRRELIECLLLERRQPRFDDWPNRAVLDFFIAYR